MSGLHTQSVTKPTIMDHVIVTVAHSLQENMSYSFRVLIINSVGTLSSKATHFCELCNCICSYTTCLIVSTHIIDTTDVQMVTATAIDGINAFIVHCEFIAGTDAQGCMVVLVGELDNITAYLERNDSKVLTANNPLSCYHDIFAFDIENDRMNGTLAIPGMLVKNFSFPTPCQMVPIKGYSGEFLNYNC